MNNILFSRVLKATVPQTVKLGAKALLLPMAMCLSFTACAHEVNSVLPPPALNEPATGHHEVVVFSGGCFWGVQGVFQHVKGVTRATSGYAGGSATTAHYETVSGGNTGHAESVKVEFDPQQVSLGELLRIYFSVAHDPTELNFQGPDTGTQYRSAIWYTSPVQQQVAQAYVAQLTKAKIFHDPIVTQISPLKAFFDAEVYHQDYLTLHPENPYIAINDIPKVENLKRLYPTDYRATPVLIGE
jgi:peptide-methionine (S)-S-oxide reductase